MTRIDGKGGSRIVPCPECKAPKGEHCMHPNGYTARAQSHPTRVRKARALIEKGRLSYMETQGARLILDEVISGAHLRGLPNLGQIRGAEIAVDAACDAIERLLRKRGARGQ